MFTSQTVPRGLSLLAACVLASPLAAQTPRPLTRDTTLTPSLGLTMEEAAAVGSPRARTPAESIEMMLDGNARFYSGRAQRPELNAFQRRAQIATQTPYAVVLGCLDSRVPLEIVFDLGLGDIFAVRVTGNVVEPGTVGSIEYAIEHLDSHLIVVMGHENCGAVSAAMLPDAVQAREPAQVQFLLGLIRPAVSNLPEIRDPKARMREAVIRNVVRQVDALSQNPTVRAAVAEGRIQVVGAYYELSSGAVDFILPDGDRTGAVPESKLPAGVGARVREIASANDAAHAAPPQGSPRRAPRVAD